MVKIKWKIICNYAPSYGSLVVPVIKIEWEQITWRGNFLIPSFPNFLIRLCLVLSAMTRHCQSDFVHLSVGAFRKAKSGYRLQANFDLQQFKLLAHESRQATTFTITHRAGWVMNVEEDLLLSIPSYVFQLSTCNVSISLTLVWINLGIILLNVSVGINVINLFRMVIDRKRNPLVIGKFKVVPNGWLASSDGRSPAAIDPTETCVRRRPAHFVHRERDSVWQHD